jgi:hypothetical protein
MIKRLFICAILVTTSLLGFSQYTDPIVIKPYWGGVRYMVNDQPVKAPGVLQMMKAVDSTAYQLMKKSRQNNTLASIMGVAGGFLVGWPLGTMVAGGEPNWTMAIVGGAISIASMPISNRAKKQATEAVDIYNNKITFHKPTKGPLYFVVNGNGVGFQLKW